jgi:hypothetical protein
MSDALYAGVLVTSSQVSTLVFRSGFDEQQQAGPKHNTSVMQRDSRLPPTIAGVLHNTTCRTTHLPAALAAAVAGQAGNCRRV